MKYTQKAPDRNLWNEHSSSAGELHVSAAGWVLARHSLNSKVAVCKLLDPTLQKQYEFPSTHPDTEIRQLGDEKSILVFSPYTIVVQNINGDEITLERGDLDTPKNTYVDSTNIVECEAGGDDTVITWFKKQNGRWNKENIETKETGRSTFPFLVNGVLHQYRIHRTLDPIKHPSTFIVVHDRWDGKIWNTVENRRFVGNLTSYYASDQGIEVRQHKDGIRYHCFVPFAEEIPSKLARLDVTKRNISDVSNVMHNTKGTEWLVHEENATNSVSYLQTDKSGNIISEERMAYVPIGQNSVGCYCVTSTGVINYIAPQHTPQAMEF